MQAELYGKTDRLRDELKTRFKIAGLNPLHPDNNYKIARVNVKQGDPESAYKFLNNNRLVSKQEVGIRFKLAQYFQLRNRQDEEFICLEKILKADPGHHQAWKTSGFAGS